MQTVNSYSELLFLAMQDSGVNWRLVTEIAIAWLSLLITAVGTYLIYLRWRSTVIIVSAQDWILLQKRNDELGKRNDELNEKLDIERQQRRQVEDKLELLKDEMRDYSSECKRLIRDLEQRIMELEMKNGG